MDFHRIVNRCNDLEARLYLINLQLTEVTFLTSWKKPETWRNTIR